MSHFTIDLAGEGDQRTLMLGGELDLAAVSQIVTTGTACLVGEPSRLVIDLSRVTFIDSSVLGAFVDLLNLATDSGKGVTLINPSEPVRRILDLTGLASVFELSATGNTAEPS